MAETDFRLGTPRPDGSDPGIVVPAEVPDGLRYLEGHFPGNPIVPGIAQLLLVERAARRAFPGLPSTGGVARLKFQARIDPGDAVAVHLERRPSEVRFRIRRGETECTRGALLLAPD